MVKRGRKTKPHRTATGDTIDGLYRNPGDGRWKILATGERFTEPDEKKAVTRFLHWKANAEGRVARFAVPFTDQADFKRKLFAGAVAEVSGHNLIERVPEAAVWDFLKEQLATRPQYVAQQTGIEQLGYLADLPKPTPSPTLEAVGELYHHHAKLSIHWERKSRFYWSEFVESADGGTLRQLTQEKFVEYGDTVLDAASSPTYSKHRFGQIKTILAYPKRRGKWAEDCQRALAFCGVLVPAPSGPLDPHPISRADFQKLLGAADEQMRALMLMALNCCLYPSEVGAVQWPEVDLDAGTFVSRRHKTGVGRVGMLWKSTIESLRTQPRRVPSLFITPATKMEHNSHTIAKAWRRLRKACGLESVKFCDIRDGAYTAAVSSGVSFDHARILAGHRTGMADHYILRQPTIVADACEAIHKTYMG